MKYTSILLVLLIAACSSPSTNNETSETPTSTITVPSIMDGDTITVVASGMNMAEIKYDTKKIKVPPKTKITIALVNESTDPTMPHNIVFIKSGTANEVGQAGSSHKDNNYVRPNDINVIANSPLAPIGETVYVTFKTPARGEYEFICSYPGHWGMMKGRFIVE